MSAALIAKWREAQQELDAFLDYLCDPEADPSTMFLVEELHGVMHE
ncbi:hypothetical protein ABZY93_21990 [Streptomyces smyrnaeus]